MELARLADYVKVRPSDLIRGEIWALDFDLLCHTRFREWEVKRQRDLAKIQGIATALGMIGKELEFENEEEEEDDDFSFIPTYPSLSNAHV